MFDILGDVHGCYDELLELIKLLGYQKAEDHLSHPDGRQLVFVGDYIDRGPKSLEVLDFIMSYGCLGVLGNHDDKLRRALLGNPVSMQHGLQATWDELAGKEESYRQMILEFLQSMPCYLQLDEGRLIVAHAGFQPDFLQHFGQRARAFCLYGAVTGELDGYGLPTRKQWGCDYRGKALIVYGHTPVLEPLWLNETVNVDTGCVFGGRLSALRYPERDWVSVRSHQVWSKPLKPIGEW